MTLLSFQQEFRPMFRLALPLIITELGWMAMGIVDSIMVSRLPNSAEAIGATGLGGILFYSVAIFGGGLLLGLDTLVSQAFGAKKLDECHRWLWQSLWLVAMITPPLMLVLWFLGPALGLTRIDASLLRHVSAYLLSLVWGTLPLLLYFAFRRYLQAMNAVQPVMFVLISANIVNAVGNYMLVYGKLGAPALGIPGSGWATTISRVYMASALLAYIVYRNRNGGANVWSVTRAIDFSRVTRLLKLGLPVALQILFEIGIFTVAAYMAGLLGVVSLAAHQITMNIASATFMVPLGISAAAAIRVGQALGRGDRDAAARAGWTALAIGSGFMSCAALCMFAFPRQIARVFTSDTAVIEMTVTLLALAGVFQIFDGLQIVSSGALRGAGDTRTPMFASLGAYWFLALPIAVYLGFYRGWGVNGIWAALCAALNVVGSGLCWWWGRKIQRPLETFHVQDAAYPGGAGH